MSASRSDFVQHLYTVTPNAAPPANWLTIGEIGIELADPAKLWVGVPTDMDPTGRKMLFNAVNLVGGPFVSKAGDIMTGFLTLSADPTANLHAATKHYVDLNFAPIAGGGYVQKSGDVMTGRLTIQNAGLTINNGNLLIPLGGSATIDSLTSTGITQLSNTGVTAQVFIGAAANTTLTQLLMTTTGTTGIRDMLWQTGNQSRWRLRVSGSESGSNAGSDMVLSRFNDTGGALAGAVLSITRATGLITVIGDPTASLGIATKNYVDTHVAVGGPFLPLTGGVLSGNLGVGMGLPAASLGSAFAATQFCSPNTGTNIYWDGTNWRFLVGGAGGGVMGTNNASYGGLIFYTAGLGANAGDVATLSNTMILNPGGMAVTGVLSATSALSTGSSLTVAGPAVLNSNLSVAGESDLQNIVSDGAYGIYFRGLGATAWIGFVWDGSWAELFVNGAYQYQLASIPWVQGNFKNISAYTPNQNVDSGSGPRFANTMIVNGLIYVADNYAYYLGRRPGDGHWTFVSNNTTLLDLDESGNLNIRSAIGIGTTIRCPQGVYFDGGSYQAFFDGTYKRFWWQSQWEFAWDSRNGQLAYWIPGGTWTVWNCTDNVYWTFNWLNGWAGNGGYWNVSDERNKLEIEPARDGLDAILGIEPIRFRRWRVKTPLPVHDEVETGFSAQQLRGVLPAAVHECGADPNRPEGFFGDEPMLAISLDPIVAALVNAVKTLNARIEALEQRTLH